ncbi:MAG TPA: hypothetical protein VND91_05340 [Candidatus Saccharimonadia bacterium]|nr:hypothetical protein [Candidatus Saccharimonadia bacterium]
MTAPPDLADPANLPFDYDDARDEWLVMPVTLDQIGNAPFLDQRMGVGPDDAQRVRGDVVAVHADAWPGAPSAFLFHTAFCGSTLLARALHAPPGAVALKEPVVLTTLTRLSLAHSTHVDALLRRALALLGRAWSADGGVLVKPTNLVNRLMPQILASAPESRAILLYASLREFLVSCFKKLPEAEVAVRWMAQVLIRDTRLQRELGLRGDEPFNLVESCVLTYYAQLEIYADALERDDGDRLRTLDMRAMLAQPAAAVAACATWLRLPAALEGLDARVANEFARDSKQSARAFDSGIREREKAELETRYGPVIEQALEWSRNAVEPFARVPRDWKALDI